MTKVGVNAGLHPELAVAVLGEALRRGGDFAEVFAEDRRSLNLRLEDGRVEDVGSGRDRGASLRIVRGNTTLFGYAESLAESDLLALARELSRGVSPGEGGGAPVVALSATSARGPASDPPQFNPPARATLLRALDTGARSRGAEVRQVLANYGELEQRVWVANSRGAFATDLRRRVLIAATVVAQREGVIQTGRETWARSGSNEPPSREEAEEVGTLAAEKSLVMLGAGPAPTGRMPVVLAQGFGGVLFHEACGHGLEADFILKQSSVWEGLLGMRVAPEFLTALDDGVGAGLWGSNLIDDEGTPAQRTVVIEQGILSAYLVDLLRGDKLGLAATGNGRRESFRHIPYPRMTNTYFAPGAGTAQDLIAATPRAFYAKSLSGGEVNPATGDFVFGVSEGYLIEGGSVGRPVRGATLVGNGRRVLESIEAVAADLEVKAGMCGKEGQMVPVGTGQPTIRIREMTVGGTQL
ncbi:MAG: TldD/PmbA family protein [Gaiellales bacterium]|nr:TldD/PmbA family protein [Gaiellales bacterium]